MMEGAMATLDHQSANAATQSRPRGMPGAPDRITGSRPELASRTRSSRNREKGGGDRGRGNPPGLSRKNSFGEHKDNKTSSSSSSNSSLGVSAISSHRSSSRDRGIRGHHRGEGVIESTPRQEFRQSSSSRKVIQRSSSGAGMGERSGSGASGRSGRDRQNYVDVFSGDVGAAVERVDVGLIGSGTSVSSRRSVSRSPRRPREVRPSVNVSTSQKHRSRGKSSSSMNSSGGGGGSSSGGPGGSGSGGTGSGGKSSDRSSSPGNTRPTSARRQTGDMTALPGQRSASGKRVAAAGAPRTSATHAPTSAESGFVISSTLSSHPGSRGPSASGNSTSGRDGEVSSTLNRDRAMSPSKSSTPTTGALTHQHPPPPQSKTPSASSPVGSFSSNGMPDPEDLTPSDIRDPTAPGVSAAHASPISRVAAAAAREGGTFSALETNQLGGGDGSNNVTGVQLMTYTRMAGTGDKGRRVRPPQVFHAVEGEGEHPEGHQQQRSRDPPLSSREDQQRRSGGEHGGRSRRSERGSRGPGHPRRRGGGPRGLPRGRSMGRAGQRGRRRSASVPQNFHRGPGAFGLAPVEEEREEEQQEDDDSPVRDDQRREEGDDGEEDDDTEDMIFKVVNKDTGEVGDLRDECLEEVPFDVLPKGFRPSEAWHPELQKHADSKAASHLDLAGAERKTSLKSGGSRFTKIMRGLKGREHHRDYDGNGNHYGGGAAAASVTSSGSAMGGGRAGNKDRSKLTWVDGQTVESAMAAASAISWPKSAKTGPAISGGRAGSGSDPAIPGDEGKQQGIGTDSSSGTPSSKAYMLLGLSIPHGQHPMENKQHPIGGGTSGVASATMAAPGPNGGVDRGPSPTPPAASVPRTSPGSGERGPTRQEMAAAKVAKRREALKHGRGLMESAVLQGVGGFAGGGFAGGIRPAPLRIGTVENDRMDELSPKGGKAGGEGDMLMSPGYKALATAAVGGQPGGSFSPLRSSMIQSIVSPRTGAAKAEAVDKAMDAMENMEPLQKFRAHAGAVWCAEFSRKGHYLATGGADGLVKIWQIGAAEDVPDGPSNRDQGKTATSLPARVSVKGIERSDSDVSLASMVSISTTVCGSSAMELDGTPSQSKVPTGELVVGGRASRVMRGHIGDVVDLSWSPNAFLLSAGRDGSIRLWHPARLGCVHLFLQNGQGCPTSCAFHPRLENSFVTAGEDGKIRVWKITSAKVETEAKMPSRTTHVRFSPDGKVLAVGMFGGLVRFLTWETLQPLAQVDLRTRKASTGVASIAFKGTNSGRGEVLVHGATGRLRLYRIEPLAAGTSAISAAVNLVRKYGYGDRGNNIVARIAKLKGHVNPGLPLRATFSEDGRFAVCGSEDGSVHVWNAGADVETAWKPRRHISFTTTGPFPGDDQHHDHDDLSLSPVAGLVTPKSNLPLRPLSVSPPVSLSPSPRRNVRGRGASMTQQHHHDGDASAGVGIEGEKHQPNSNNVTRPRQARRWSSPLGRSPTKGISGRKSPVKAAPAPAPAVDKSVGGPGKAGDRRGKGAVPGTTTATAATGGGRGAKPDGAGSGAAVTLAAFIPKAATSRFQEANGIVSSRSPQRKSEGLVGHQRPSSQKYQSQRLAEIPSIAEVVHPIEDSDPVSRSSLPLDIDDSQFSAVRRPVRRSSAPTLSPPPQLQQQQQQHEEDHKKQHHRHHQHQHQHHMGRNVEVNVDIDSQVDQSKRDHHRRRSKKPRGAVESLGLGDLLASGAGSGSGGMPRSQSFPDALVPRSPQKARHRPPPPYKSQTLGDLLSSSKEYPDDSTKSGAATPPPPFDPDARWGWDSKVGGEEGWAPRDSFDVKSREGRTSFVVTESAEALGGVDESGAAAARVVTVDVYQSQVPEIEPEEYDADRPGIVTVTAKKKERGRRREFHRRRSEGGGIEGRERREDGSSPVPLVEIVTSSPSVSPTRPGDEGQTSPLLSLESSGMFPHSPIQMASSGVVHPPHLPPSNAGLGVPMNGKGVTISEKGGDGNRDSSVGGRGGETEANEWPWEAHSTQAGTGGGRKKESTTTTAAAAARGTADAGGLSAESKLTALPSNSLMLAADSLGNIRIYAMREVMDSLNKSAFCSQRTS